MTSRLGEVSRKVGVSETTVSRVLNGKRGVSAATRQAVLTALDVLGYERPSQLRATRAQLIGLVLPELQNPIFQTLAEVVGGALVQLGFTPMLCTNSGGGLTETQYVMMLLERQVSGAIFFEDLSPTEHHRLVERKLPVVLVNSGIDYAFAKGPQDLAPVAFPRVSTDDGAAVRQAFTHLRTLGHEQIALLVGPAGHEPSRRKLERFEALARETWPQRAPLVGHALFSFEGGMAVASDLIGRGATGVICGSDILAMGAIRAARRSGLAVPSDVSIVGYDDSPFMNYTDPPLTTLRQPVNAMARAAVTLLVNQIQSEPATPTELLHEPELVVRSSTGPVRPSAAQG
jgi:DNA-binding LacI/PurR family transcriptional regulator